MFLLFSPASLIDIFGYSFNRSFIHSIMTFVVSWRGLGMWWSKPLRIKYQEGGGKSGGAVVLCLADFGSLVVNNKFVLDVVAIRANLM